MKNPFCVCHKFEEYINPRIKPKIWGVPMIRGATLESKTKRCVRLVKPEAVRQGKGHAVSLPLHHVVLVPSSGSFAAPLSLPRDRTTQRVRHREFYNNGAKAIFF
jgi:hypothetical protein